MSRIILAVGVAAAALLMSIPLLGFEAVSASSTATFVVHPAYGRPDPANPGARIWLDTGIDLGPTVTTTLTATGTAKFCGPPCVSPAMPPTGDGSGVCLNSTFPCAAPAVSAYALIGKVGAGGTPFLVGNGPVTPAGTGRLYLAFNDGNYTDNCLDDFAACGGFVVTAVTNADPDCSPASPSVAVVWPPNHKLVPVEVAGVTDADGDQVAITIDSIFQDEPTNALGDGNSEVDGQGVGTSTAAVRAERSGTKNAPGDGRVYHISFTADDGSGGACSGTVRVGVPHNVSEVPTDGGALYDSTAP